MHGKVDLLIIRRGPFFAFYQQKSELPTVCSERKIIVSGSMRVIPAGPGRLRRERVTVCSTGRNHRRSLLHRAVISWVDRQSVPMNQVGT